MGSIFGSFLFVPPQYVMIPPVTEHVTLHIKSLCTNMVLASGGANNMRLLSWWGSRNGKDPYFFLKPLDLFFCAQSSSDVGFRHGQVQSYGGYRLSDH